MAQNRGDVGDKLIGGLSVAKMIKEILSPSQQESLLKILQARFIKHPHRHPDVEWTKVAAKLEASPGKLVSLQEMEATGGEPDVVWHDAMTGEFLLVDCSSETPTGRVSLCYDRAGLESRKDHPPKNTALDLAAAMGIEPLTEAQYLDLQILGEFDRKTSSWVKAPVEIRRLGGALYGERRYGRVFVGHNGAQSYYAVRGFRGVLRV